MRAAIARAKLALDEGQALRAAVEAVAGDPEALTEVLAFYRLVAAWLLRTAAPAAGGGPLSLPLPEQVCAL